MITKFFIMYCPSIVGTANLLQVISGKRNNGKKVVIICKTRRIITRRSCREVMNKIPIKHSNNPKIIKNVGKDIKEIVSLKRLWTRGLAGDKPKTFKIPK